MVVLLSSACAAKLGGYETQGKEVGSLAHSHHIVDNFSYFKIFSMIYCIVAANM